MRNILWSGGWDSTFLLCLAARTGEEIQPVYLKFPHDSMEREKEARENILALLKEKGIENIRAPVDLEESDLPEDADYDAAYQRLIREVGGQYRVLGKVAKLYPNLEIGIEAPAPGFRENGIGRIETFMNEHGLTINDDGTVTAEDETCDAARIYGCYRFPIIRINTAQMWETIQEWGWEDIALATRTCNSALTRNCGACWNCEVKWRYGDTFRFLFDEKAQKDRDIKEWMKEHLAGAYTYRFMQFVRNEETVFYPHDRWKQADLVGYFNTLREKWPEVENVKVPML